MSHRQKVTAEQKLRVVRDYLSGKITVRDAADRLNVGKAAIRDWVNHYKAEGENFFRPSGCNRVYTTELKEQAVQSYLNGEGSQVKICLKFGIRSRCQLQDWIKLYNTHGDFNSIKHSGGGSYMSKARSTTQEERVQIARTCLALDKNYGETAKKYNVSYQQVRTWTMRYMELGEAGLEDRRGRRKKDQTPRTELEKAQIEIEKLKHQLYLAEMERDLLKKLQEVERRERLGR